MKTSFYSQSELKSLGLKAYGRNVLISKKASFYNPSQISLGHHVRIDDFCKKNWIRKIDFLRLDTEGYELNILKGAKKIWKK